MKTPLTLYYAPDNASLCAKLLLGEMQIDYETALVDRRNKAHKSKDYLRLNPNGLIPTLVTPDGPIYETAAILLWLADQQPGTVFPAPQDPTRGAALSQLFWVSNTLHVAARMLFYPGLYTNGDHTEMRAKTRANLIMSFDQIASLGGPDTLPLRCYLAPLLRWCALYGGETTWFELSKWPVLLEFAQTFEQRPKVVEVCRTEGLGITPFSAPQFPHPPEGSAT